MMMPSVPSADAPQESRSRRLWPWFCTATLLLGFGLMLLSHLACRSGNRGAYYLYVAGMALMFWGGSAVFISLYGLLSRNKRLGPVQEAAAELDRHRQLLAALHVACFGAYILLTLLAYDMRPAQDMLLALVRNSLLGGKGPLGAVAQAYRDRNVPLAAARTVAVNFLLGSVAVITLPSLAVPGIGAGLMLLRFALVGFILAPTSPELSRALLPHSVTVLVELEAYVVAGFFGLMVPLYLFSRARGPSLWHRYRQALVLNLKGSLLVLAILAVAGFYEAVEVIAQM